MKRVTAIVCAFVLLLPLGGCSKAGSDQDWEESYGITGTEHTQLWDLKYDAFLSAYNALIVEDTMKLDYLEAYDPSSSNCMLTKNGESWKLLLKVFSENEADASWFKKDPDASSWVGNVESVELSLFSTGTKDAEENGLYIRYLISLLTPGAEEYVENALGIYGEPADEAVVSSGVYQIYVGDVLYSYTSGDSFLAEPCIKNWPAEEVPPTAIRPE